MAMGRRRRSRRPSRRAAGSTSAARTRGSGRPWGRPSTPSTPTPVASPRRPPRWASRRRTWSPSSASNPRCGNGPTSCASGTGTSHCTEAPFEVPSPPPGFSWIDRPYLAACARPEDSDELVWLRRQGVQLLLTLSEHRVRRDWVDAAGLLAMHVPIVDMDAPTQEQLDRCVSAMTRARAQAMGVAVHCTAGLGRTGAVLAAYFVAQGFTPHA